MKALIPHTLEHALDVYIMDILASLIRFMLFILVHFVHETAKKSHIESSILREEPWNCNYLRY